MSKIIKSRMGGYLNKRNLSIKSFKEIPGPSALPIIGQLHHFIPGGSLYNLRGFDLQNFLFEKYGPVVKLKGNFGAPDSVLIFDPESSLRIYRKENLNPLRKGFNAVQYYKHVIKKERGQERKYNGLIFDHEEPWREIRTVVNPVMMQAKSLMAYTEPLDEIAQEAVDRIKSIRDESNMIKDKFLDEFMSYVLECTGEITLGERFYAFSPNTRENSVPGQLLQNVQKFFTLSDKLDYQPNSWRYYKNKTFRSAMKTLDEAEQLNTKLLRDSVEKLNNDPKSAERMGILQKLAEIDMDVALAFADDIFLVGIDTVANACVSTLYLLANNPDKQSKLREEILSNRSRRPYLRACIKEAMRLRPVSFGNLRLTTTDYDILNYQIPKDTLVLLCHEHMSAREDQYPQPHHYIPERWLVDKDHPLYHGNAHPTASAPFGYGARGCVGQKVADMEMETLLSRIIQNFNTEWRGGPMSVYQSVINRNMAPYNFVFNDM